MKLSGWIHAVLAVVTLIQFARVDPAVATPPKGTFEALAADLRHFGNTTAINEHAFKTCSLARDEFERRDCLKERKAAAAEIEKKALMFVDQPVVVGDYDFESRRFPLHLSKIVFGTGIAEEGSYADDRYVSFTLGRVNTAPRNPLENVLTYYFPMKNETDAKEWKRAVNQSAVTADVIAKFSGYYEARGAWGQTGKVANMQVLGVRIRDVRTGQILYSSPASSCRNYRDCYLDENGFFLPAGTRPANALVGDVPFALSGVPDELRVLVDGIILNKMEMTPDAGHQLRSHGGTVQARLADGKHVLAFEMDDIHAGMPKGPYVLDLKPGEKLFLSFATLTKSEDLSVFASQGESKYEALEFLGFRMGETVEDVLLRLPADREVLVPGFKDQRGQPLPVQGYRYRVRDMPGVKSASVVFFAGRLYNISLLYGRDGQPEMTKLIAFYTEKLGPPTEHTQRPVVVRGQAILEEVKWQTRTTHALLRRMSDQAVEFHLFETATTARLTQAMEGGESATRPSPGTDANASKSGCESLCQKFGQAFAGSESTRSSLRERCLERCAAGDAGFTTCATTARTNDDVKACAALPASR
jgi:hypothetical protein